MKRFKKLKAGSSVSLDVKNPDTVVLVRPKGNTTYSDTASVFTVLSEYRFCTCDNMNLTLTFETAKADIDRTFHTFRRVSLVGFDGLYNVTYSVIAPDKMKSGGSAFLGELLGNLFFDAGLPLLFGLIAWANTDSVAKGLITAAVTLAVVTAVTLGTEKLFDKLFDKRKKRKGFPCGKEPKGFTQCLDPGYIDCVFKMTGF